MRRYLFLWGAFEDKEFDFESAFRVLQGQRKEESKKVVALFLSELRKKGWLIVKFDPEDSRKRIYSLKYYDNMYKPLIGKGKENRT